MTNTVLIAEQIGALAELQIAPERDTRGNESVRVPQAPPLTEGV